MTDPVISPPVRIVGAGGIGAARNGIAWSVALDIPSLGADTAPDTASGYIIVYDDNEAATRRVLLDTILSGTGGGIFGPATTTSGLVPVWDGSTGSALAAGFAVTTFAKALLDDNDAATMRATLDMDAAIAAQSDVATNTAARHGHTNKAILDAIEAAFTSAEQAKLAGIEPAADMTDTGNVAAAGAFMKAADDLDDIADGTSYRHFTASEKTKLAGVAGGATANSADATLLARANHTGTQSADTIVDGTTNKAFGAAEKTKLAGLALPGAFRATKPSAQTDLADGTYTKVTLAAEDFDGGGWWNPATSRLQPSVACTMFVGGAALLIGISSGGFGQAAFIKNGTDFLGASVYYAEDGGGYINAMAQAIVTFNGTTDYLELHAYNGGAASCTVAATTSDYASTEVFGWRIA